MKKINNDNRHTVFLHHPETTTTWTYPSQSEYCSSSLKLYWWPTLDVLDVFGFLLAAVECWLQTHPSQFLNSWFDLRDATPIHRFLVGKALANHHSLQIQNVQNDWRDTTPIDHFLMGEALENQNLLQTLNLAEEAAANPSLGNGQIVLAEAVEEDYNRRNFWVEEHYFLVACVVGCQTSAN